MEIRGQGLERLKVGHRNRQTGLTVRNKAGLLTYQRQFHRWHNVHSEATHTRLVGQESRLTAVYGAKDEYSEYVFSAISASSERRWEEVGGVNEGC